MTASRINLTYVAYHRYLPLSAIYSIKTWDWTRISYPSGYQARGQRLYVRTYGLEETSGKRDMVMSATITSSTVS